MFHMPVSVTALSSAPLSRAEFELNQFEFVLEGLSPATSGLRIVQISDFHRGYRKTPDALISAAVGAANALDPDYIVVTGDFVEGPEVDVRPAAALSRELKARRGVFAVLGNHDQRGDPELLRRLLEEGGISVLHNRAEELPGGLWLAGVDDMKEGTPDFESALREVPPGAALILLSHIPDAVDLVRDRPLLVLSGHTHGGQIVVPFPPPALVCRRHLKTRYVHGWYRRGQATLYVNRGIGVTGPPPWLNKRFRCPPEITEFTLRAPKDRP